jgi:uncharacterized protein YjbI with pentapeptide repeats
MKRARAALLAVLVLSVATVALGVASADAGEPKPLTVKTFDPFYPLVARRYEPAVAPGTNAGGCVLLPGADCPGVELEVGPETYEVPGADLSKADLRGATLRLAFPGASFAAADLREADLDGTEAAAVTAPFADFGKADLGGFEAVLGRLAGSDFRGAEMYESSFFAADLAGADLRGANPGGEFAGAVLSGADLRGVNLRRADLEFADLSHAKLTKGALKDARLCDTVLPSGKVANKHKRCELPALYVSSEERPLTIQPTDARYSLLFHAAGTWRGEHREKCGDICPEGGQWLTHLRGPSYAYAHLPGTHRFAGKAQALVNLTGADLTDADMARAVIPGAASSSTDFAGADLDGADLTYSELAAADLAGARLGGLDARDADLTRADLAGADLSGARLSATSLVEADLHGVDWEGADLSGADLYGAEVDPTFPAGATLCDTVMPDGSVAAPGGSCEHR